LFLKKYIYRKYYELGIGTSCNLSVAFEWYHKSASKGYEPAERKMNILDQKETTNLSKSYIDKSMRLVDEFHQRNVEQIWNMA
jgi:TPR repeat protein